MSKPSRPVAAPIPQTIRVEHTDLDASDPRRVRFVHVLSAERVPANATLGHIELPSRPGEEPIRHESAVCCASGVRYTGGWEGFLRSWKAREVSEVTAAAPLRAGDRVKIAPGFCGEGYRFTVTEIGMSGHGEPIVYGDNYGPVRASECVRA